MEKTDYHFRFKDTLIGLQFLFVAFGALVLVPLLTGLDPNVALFTAGIGTLLFQLINKERVPPIFLASSFAFIAPIIAGTQQWGIASTMGGLVATGLFYVILSFLVRFRGDEFIHHLLPPIVVGPVIMTIGLILSPIAVNMAMGRSGDGASVLVAEEIAIPIALVSCAVAILSTLLGKGFLKLLPILAGIGVGYGVALFYGAVDFTPIKEAKWFALPAFSAPKWQWEAIIFLFPIAIAPAVEHIGDMLAISNVTGKNYLEKPGLKSTLLGDGIATSAAALLGGPPNTTYSEVTGAVTLTKAYNPAIMTWAAIFAIGAAFVGKIGGFLQTIPTPVMGGILLILFGIITSVGIATLVRAQVDFGNSRNMIIVSLILISAIGGMSLKLGGVSFSGIALGAIVGIVLNLILPKGRHDLIL